MSIRAELHKAEQMVKEIETYVEQATWHSGRNCRAAIEIEEIDRILRNIETAPPPVFAQVYLQQVDKVADLRRRWLAAKDRLPVNPWQLTRRLQDPVEDEV